MFAKNRQNYNLPKIYTKTPLEHLLALKESMSDKFVYSDVMIEMHGRQYKKQSKTVKDNDY